MLSSILEDSDGSAELLNVAGLHDARWDRFTLLLGPVGIYRLVEGDGVVWKDDAVGQCQCEAFAEYSWLWWAARAVQMVGHLSF